MLQSSGSGNNESTNEIKTQLISREGLYRLVPQAEYGRPKTSFTPQVNTSNASSSSLPLVRISFTKLVPTNSMARMAHQMNHEDNNINNGQHQLTSSPNQAKLNGSNDSDRNECLGNSVHHNHYHNHIHHNNTIANNLQADKIQERICFNVGRELFIYNFNGLQPSDATKLDRKSYKSTSPTCHDFCTLVEQQVSLLLIGFSLGQIQLIDLYRPEISKYYNQERCIDKSKVTCIRWLPRSRNNFLVSYSSGQMYVYKEDLPCFNTAPTYQQFKCGDGFAIFTCKTRTTRNPLFRWAIGCTANTASNSSNSGGMQAPSQTAINEFQFSPCGQYLAVVSQDGFLRVFHYEQMELIGLMRSYFGGLLCVGWSPDSKFLVTGGEDDLITVWSLQDKRVIARGQGHKSWVNAVLFDPFMTKTKEEEDEEQQHHDRHSDIDCDSVDDPHNFVPNNKRQTDEQLKVLTNYRIGSVGQDTQICLWDLTDDIIRQSSVIKSRSRSTISSSGAVIGANNGTESSHRTSRLLNNLMGVTSNNSTSNYNASGSSSTPNHHHSNFFNSLKKSGHKKGFSLSSRSFLDHGKHANKNHHSGSNKNLNADSNHPNDVECTNSNESTSTSKLLRSSTNTPSTTCDSSRLLGTVLCPRLKEVPMLEPHVCKKISHERLTSLVFRRDSLVVANHDGKIIVFARPNRSMNGNSTLKVSSPNASMASDVNEISTAGGVVTDGHDGNNASDSLTLT